MARSVVKCTNCGKPNRLSPTAEGVPRCANCHQLLPWVVDAGQEDFDAEVTASVPVLVDMWAPWCMPCKQVTPLLENVARTNSGRLKLVKLNVDNAPDIAARFGVQGIPTLLVIRNGNEVDRLVGAAPQPQIEGWLEQHLPDGMRVGNAR
ncbi:MAG: thioredoxin [Actinobacteria bacterium 13_1_20CM_3_68_9]|nr:MAG: thioredoxin [Actinobacteria bacterium 13_1_20CM_3_68_9]